MRSSIRSALILSFALVGCGSSGGSSDGGVDGGPDGPTQPAAMVQVGGAAQPADYSCNGHRMDPAGSTTEFTIGGKVEDFQTKDAVPTAVVSVFESTQALVSGMAYDSKTADANGMVTGLKIPANHYRVAFKIVSDQQIDTYEVGIPVGSGTTTMTFNSVSRFTAMALPGLVGIDYDMTKSAIAGAIRDCGLNVVQNASVSLQGASTSTDAGVPINQPFYFKDGLPVRRGRQAYSNIDGLFTVLNVSLTGTATVEAQAVLTEGAAPTTVGRESIPLYPDSLTIVDVPPMAQ